MWLTKNVRPRARQGFASSWWWRRRGCMLLFKTSPPSLYNEDFAPNGAVLLCGVLHVIESWGLRFYQCSSPLVDSYSSVLLGSSDNFRSWAFLWESWSFRKYLKRYLGTRASFSSLALLSGCHKLSRFVLSHVPWMIFCFVIDLIAKDPASHGLKLWTEKIFLVGVLGCLLQQQEAE